MRPHGRQEKPSIGGSRDGLDHQDESPSEPAPMGREAELARIRRALDDLPRRGEALHIVGDPGVGKSEVLDAAAREATTRGLQLLSMRGTSESHLGFAALHRLLRPVVGGADALPSRHRAALLIAFGLIEGDG